MDKTFLLGRQYKTGRFHQNMILAGIALLVFVRLKDTPYLPDSQYKTGCQQDCTVQEDIQWGMYWLLDTCDQPDIPNIALTCQCCKFHSYKLLHLTLGLDT